ncbi:thioredoxin-like protein [Syncephalis pseudoplumigaleata]|uniref:Thioredoxin n=1 Tax=Syncephalis pseudoplumigaleata TaxID=1712513 RepID=A0A4P9Z4P1_9FUNG|nr:thioredoxin-like protein [Syncephalis pseudoplumigaleata]|eukprot:RKP27554.1 thioredoxin-like protein [Syncephalis pseudoplumigaleata]
MVREVTTAEEFDQIISSNSIVVVDFFAEWCGPCRLIAPKIEALAEKTPDVTFIKLDVDKVEEIAQRYGIRAMPTFIFFKDGEKAKEVVGADPGAVASTLAAVKSS